MSLQEELEKREIYNHIVNVIHISDGFLITRLMSNVPRKGDWLVIGDDTFVVNLVIWNINDTRATTLMVEEPKN